MVIEQKAKPELREGWVMISVEEAGICGSDVARFLGRGYNVLTKPPLVMGHEFAGTVTELGPAVSSDWKGQAVTVNPLLTCGNCRDCKNGKRQICANRKLIGVDHPGAFADSVTVPVSACYKIKDGVAGALVEPLACALRAANLSEAVPGDSVMVIGAGTIGLMAVRVMKSMGVQNCIVLDTNSNRLQWAANWGASRTLNPKTDSVSSLVKPLTSGDGVDVVVDAVGSNETRLQSVSLVRQGGRAVWLGLHDNTSPLPGNDVVRFEKQIIGSFAYSDDDFRRAVSLANSNFIETTSGWLDTRSLESGQESFVEQAGESAPFSKILLDPRI